MRKSLLLASALALLPLAPAIAQPTSPAAAPKLELTAEQRAELTAEQRAELQQSLTRGRALAVLDQAGRVATKDMLERVADPAAAGIAGWIAQIEGNGVTVTFYARDGEQYRAVYKGQVLAGRVASPQLYLTGERPLLAGQAARMAAARTASEALEQQPCGSDFNALVLPPEADGPVLVYRMSPRMAADKVPVGGHFRVTVADGAAEAVALGGACTDLTLPRVVAGQRPRPPVVNARDLVLPNELHVFISLWVRRPIVVATGTGPGRLWGVTGEGIAELSESIAELQR